MTGKELLGKIEEFNKFYDGKVRHQMTAKENADGSVDVNGPLRIYWGLSRPIQLAHCDDIPPAPISQWRHSLCVGPNSPKTTERKLSLSTLGRSSSISTHVRELDDILRSPNHKSREMDDSLMSPSSPDDVVRRKKNKVRKFKTVAYRGDQPTRWKRASINGHIFNYDTSVFTPVLGSCTCVAVTGHMTSSDVIETLLDKFKVQNCPEEYVLYIVNEEGERRLTASDKPLLERLKVGPDESAGKLFIKEQDLPGEVVATESPVQLPIVEAVEEENLPYEVEQLLILPEAVLRGILAKYKKDEELDVSLVKGRYECARKQILQRMNEMSYLTSSTV